MPIVDVTHQHISEETYVNEEAIIEADSTTDMDVFLDTICASADCYDESAIQDIKQTVINISDLWKQWRKYTNSFVKHKWLYRYVDEKQKVNLQKHYDTLCAEKTNYSTYKRSFGAVCKFFGLPTNTIILENMVFSKDKDDKEQDIVAVKYSKGVAKVTIPEGIRLIHSTTAEFDQMIPAFRSKTVGKYMYPTKRCFFTCIKTIDNNKAGMEGQKTHKYTPKTPIRTAYIDPTYSDFAQNAVYVETDQPIPVMDYRSLKDKISSKLNIGKKKEG